MSTRMRCVAAVAAALVGGCAAQPYRNPFPNDTPRAAYQSDPTIDTGYLGEHAESYAALPAWVVGHGWGTLQQGQCIADNLRAQHIQSEDVRALMGTIDRTAVSDGSLASGTEVVVAATAMVAAANACGVR